MPARKAKPDPALLERAGEILGLPVETLIYETGYIPSNKDKTRVAAAMAELCVVVALHECGFNDIRLVKKSPKSSRTADIQASREGKDYAVEVKCVTRQSSFSGVNHMMGRQGEVIQSHRDPESVLEDKFRNKIKQVNAFRKSTGIAYGVVFLVIESENFNVFINEQDLNSMTRNVYERAGAPQKTHLCILAGEIRGVWPAWP